MTFFCNEYIHRFQNLHHLIIKKKVSSISKLIKSPPNLEEYFHLWKCIWKTLSNLTKYFCDYNFEDPYVPLLGKILLDKVRGFWESIRGISMTLKMDSTLKIGIAQKSKTFRWKYEESNCLQIMRSLNQWQDFK